MHDYNFEWDYTLDTSVNKEVVKYVNDYINKSLKKNLLNKLKMFNDVKIEFLKGRAKKNIAIYVHGTYFKPCIGIYNRNLEVLCKHYDVDYYRALRTSILHEIAHAIQDYFNLDFDENEAEYFADVYDEWGLINNFWKP